MTIDIDGMVYNLFEEHEVICNDDPWRLPETSYTVKVNLGPDFQLYVSGEWCQRPHTINIYGLTLVGYLQELIDGHARFECIRKKTEQQTVSIDWIDKVEVRL